jgi:DNA-binding CsgD family transcriptional regulator
MLHPGRIVLTKREIELVQLVSQGLTNKEICTILLLTEGSVKVYFSKLFKKARVKDRLELCLYGLRHFNNRLPMKETASLPALVARNRANLIYATTDATLTHGSRQAQ